MSAVPPAPRARPRSANRFRLLGVIVVVIAALAVLLWQGLSDATVYFRTADEAIAQREQLDEKRFRIEGIVVPGSVTREETSTSFQIASKNTTVSVRNSGEPGGIFQDNIPVVLEGRFASGSNLFLSDRIMVKHSAEYEEKHPERVSGDANKNA